MHRGIRSAWLAFFALPVAIALPWPPSAAQGCEEDHAAMRVYVDPATGEFVTPPPGAAGAPGAAVAPTQSQPAQPAEPVRQERVPGGGFKIDTRGRLQPVVGSVEPCGEAKVGCTHAPSP